MGAEQKLRAYDPDQVLLMAPSLQEWVLLPIDGRERLPAAHHALAPDENHASRQTRDALLRLSTASSEPDHCCSE
jgi:hypothetical protein